MTRSMFVISPWVIPNRDTFDLGEFLHGVSFNYLAFLFEMQLSDNWLFRE
jgi:hypothetical protein